jgi:hypothetical protein
MAAGELFHLTLVYRNQNICSSFCDCASDDYETMRRSSERPKYLIAKTALSVLHLSKLTILAIL